MAGHVDQQHPSTAPPDGLWSGPAGTALLSIERARWGTGTWPDAHACITTAATTPVAADPAASMARGAPAVAFALSCAGLDAYQPVLATLDRHITAITRQRLHQAHRRIRAGQFPKMNEYDLISGLTGLGACLLHRDPSSPALREVLSYLVRLTEPVTASGEQAIPGWWSPDGPSGSSSPAWPGGHANHGIAHGITGPLALLATAARRGTTVPGWREAIGRICDWLHRWQQGTHAAPWWPEMISAAELRANQTGQASPGRPSWCYGTPGIARALQSAALATNERALRATAEQALAACAADPAQHRQLTDASLCHGWAGLLHTIRCAAADATDPGLLDTSLLDQGLRRYVRTHGWPQQDSLLTGSTGIRLVTDIPRNDARPRSAWDQCLLISTIPADTDVQRPVSVSGPVAS